MALSDEERIHIESHGGPTWKGRTTELLVEAATILTPEKRYSSNLFVVADRTRNEREFRKITACGIFKFAYPEHVEANREAGCNLSGGNPGTYVEFTVEGVEYSLGAINARLAQLNTAKEALTRLLIAPVIKS